MVRPHLTRYLLALLSICLQLQSCDGEGAGKRTLFQNSVAVVEFEPEEFKEKVLKSNRAWIVDYYADWCGHCRHFAPIWDEVSKYYRDTNEKRVVFGALNCARFGQFCGSISVRSYPTLRWYNFPELKNSKEENGADLGKRFNVKELKKLFQPEIDKLPAFSDVEQATSSSSEPSVTELPSQAAAAEAPSLRGSNKKAAADESDSKKPQEVHEEAAALHLVDAEVAIVYSLRQSAYLGSGEQSSRSSGKTGSQSDAEGQPRVDDTVSMTGEALAELVLWLEFLAAVFPNQRAGKSLRKLVEVARSAQDTRGALVRDTWVKVLEGQAIDRVPPAAGEDPSPYFRVCGTYTCGLWTLFHILTICVAEASRNPFEVFRREGMPTPSEALTRIRGFVNHFFGCAECREHFLEAYDSCRFSRCDLRSDDGPGSALWLWQQHNDVTRRVAQEDKPGSPPAPLWPLPSDCSACWPTSERWDSNEVYAYLRRQYWRPTWWSGYGAIFAQSSGSGMAAMPEFALVGGLLAFAAAAVMLWYGVPGRIRKSSRMKGC